MAGFYGSKKLLACLRYEFSILADPVKAPQMKAYMKSEMPYHRVPAPLVKKICRQLFLHLDIPNFKAWEKQVLEIWRNVSHPQ